MRDERPPHRHFRLSPFAPRKGGLSRSERRQWTIFHAALRGGSVMSVNCTSRFTLPEDPMEYLRMLQAMPDAAGFDAEAPPESEPDEAPPEDAADQSDAPSSNGRDARGRFAKGNLGGP